VKSPTIYEVREYAETGLILLALVLLLNEARKAYTTDEPDPDERFDPPAHLSIDRDLLDALAEGDVDGETLAEAVEVGGEDLGESEEAC